jgi:two-component system chemotaxis response regulator CheB
MKALKLKGARTVVQDEASCVVYGMPKAAVELGVVDHIVSLDKMPAFLVDLAGKPRSRPTPLSI